MATKKTPELGDIAKDIVTGFEGTAVCITRYRYNSDRLTIQPIGVKDGKTTDALAFDIDQLEYVKKGPGAVLPVPTASVLIEFGDEVKDPVTGFRGVVLGRACWLNGCTRLGVQPQTLKSDGLPAEWQWLDEREAKLVKRAVLPSPREEMRKTGGPMPAERRSTNRR